MKKITLLLFLLIASFSYAQLLVDFEGGAYGGTFDYSEENSGATDDGVFAQAANPVSTGNPSATAAEIITDVAGQPWQNAQLFLIPEDEIDFLNPASKTLSVLVYSDSPTGILAKVVDGANDPSVAGEIATDAQHTGSGWETLNFDFNNAKDGTTPHDDVYSRILFFVKWETSTPGWDCPFNGPCPVETVWIDDITNTSTVLGTEDFNKISIKAYPNPTKSSWSIRSNNNDIDSIEIYNVLGKNVMSLRPYSNEAIIDGSSLGSGLYFARVSSELGDSTIKLVKK